MNLIKKLQECSTIAQADPILLKLHAGPAVKKLVETAIILNNSTDPQQRSHAFSFMESAIKEMEDDEDFELPESDYGEDGNMEEEVTEEEAQTFRDMLEENLMAKMMEDAQSANAEDARKLPTGL